MRCDVGQVVGIGHFMRSAALAEEMISRGWHVEFCADVASASLARSRLNELGCAWRTPLITASQHRGWLSSSKLDAVVIDSYLLDPEVSQELTRCVPTLTVIDGSPRQQSGSLYLDQNFGAETLAWPTNGTPSPEAPRLAGTEYAVLADRFRALRPASAPAPRLGAPLTVVLTIGGTDAMGLSERVAEAILSSSLPLELTVVSAKLAARDLGSIAIKNDPRVKVTAPSMEFQNVLAKADLVVSAAGSSLWELCILGKPVAALAVAENQVPAYSALVAAGVIYGLADIVSAAGPGLDGVSQRFARLLTDGMLRAQLARQAFRLVDGDGRIRVVDVFESEIAAFV
jgi:spore coat polysaccharide biosynthesis predicted glycosyltransferase SpsG